MADVTRHQHNGLKGELIRLLGQLPCDGPDPQLGGCPDRRHGICREVEKLDYCAVQALAEHLIAFGVTIQKWIPVTERLPERDGQYLCNYHFGTHRDMTFTRVLDYYATDKTPHFQHTLGDSAMNVTHWMPLPQPPVEGSP